jgi:hypothetical protein
MKNKYLLIIFFLLTVFTVSSYGQKWKLRRYEAAFHIGTSNFYGDIGPSSNTETGLFKDVQLQYTRPSFGLGIRYKLTGDMNLKMNLIYGFVKGSDLNSLNWGEGHRSYSFTSTIFEPSVQFEYYLIPESRSNASAALFNRRGMVNNYSKVYLYVFGGVGGAFANPYIKDSTGIIIPPAKPFSKVGVVFPVGIGLKYTIDAKWSLGFEFGRRWTTTDFIDGLKPPSSQHNDIYDFGMFSAIYKVKTDRRGRPVFGGSSRFRR